MHGLGLSMDKFVKGERKAKGESMSQLYLWGPN